MRLTVFVVALVLVGGLAPAFSSTAEAAPCPGGSFVPAVRPGGTSLEQVWGFLSRFWSKEGCRIDPLGAPSNKEGSIFAPLGAPSNKAGSIYDPLGAPSNEAGSSFDPLGAPAPGHTVEAGCSLDPLGACGR